MNSAGLKATIVANIFTLIALFLPFLQEVDYRGNVDRDSFYDLMRGWGCGIEGFRKPEYLALCILICIAIIFILTIYSKYVKTKYIRIATPITSILLTSFLLILADIAIDRIYIGLILACCGAIGTTIASLFLLKKEADENEEEFEVNNTLLKTNIGASVIALIGLTFFNLSLIIDEYGRVLRSYRLSNLFDEEIYYMTFLVFCLLLNILFAFVLQGTKRKGYAIGVIITTVISFITFIIFAANFSSHLFSFGAGFYIALFSYIIAVPASLALFTKSLNEKIR